MGDAIVGMSRMVTMKVVNTSKKFLKFNIQKPFVDKGEFRFKPQIGHIAPKQEKVIKVSFKSGEQLNLQNIPVAIQYSSINYTALFDDWDDQQTIMKLIRPSELNKIQIEKKNAEGKARVEAEIAALGKQKPKVMPSYEEIKVPEIDLNEEANIEYFEPIPEPAHTLEEGSSK